VPGPGRGLGAVVLLAVLVAVLLFGGEGSEDGVAPNAATYELGGRVSGEVLRVVDGDTIEVDVDGRTEDVRLIGVDTPETVKPGEPVQCFGPQASEFTKRVLEGETVRLEFDRELRDVYDRLLAYVHVGELFVNAELIDGGFARTLEIEPNTSRAAELARLQQAAGAAGRGLWGAC